MSEFNYSEHVAAVKGVKLGDKTFVHADQVGAALNTLQEKVDTLPKCYIPKGSCTVAFANEQTYSSEQVGWVYNLSDAGVITNGVGGEPIKVKAGDNIVWIDNGDGTTPAYCWDKLSSGSATYTGEGAIVVDNEAETIAISLDKAAKDDGKVIDNDTTLSDIIGWLGGTFVAFRIGDSYYTTFAAAIAAAQDGDTISFLEDTTFSGVEIAKGNASGTGITLDLGGHVLTASAPRDFDVSGSKLVIANGTVNATTIKVYGGSDLTVAADATVNVTYQEGVQVDGATLNVYGTVCQQVKNSYTIYADSPASATVINIEEGAVVKTLSDNKTFCVAAYGDNITVNMNGGTIDAQSYGFEVDPLVVLNLTRGVVKSPMSVAVDGGSSLHDPLTEENCGVYFSVKEREDGQFKLADLCATGYGPVKVGGTGEYANYWKIAALPPTITKIESGSGGGGISRGHDVNVRGENLSFDAARGDSVEVTCTDDDGETHTGTVPASAVEDDGSGTLLVLKSPEGCAVSDLAKSDTMVTFKVTIGGKVLEHDAMQLGS